MPRLTGSNKLESLWGVELGNLTFKKKFYKRFLYVPVRRNYSLKV